jgi:hypothetical protein
MHMHMHMHMHKHMHMHMHVPRILQQSCPTRTGWQRKAHR